VQARVYYYFRNY